MKICLFVVLLFVGFSTSSQDLTFSVTGGKPGRIKATAGKVEKNEFTLVLQAQWLKPDMMPMDDNDACIVFDKREVTLPTGLRCKTFESSASDIFMFNNNLTLNFSVDESYIPTGKPAALDFNFQFAQSPHAALDKTAWLKFLARSPRNYMVLATITDKDVKDLTPPVVSVISPEGIMEGYRPTIFETGLEVKVALLDKSPIREVIINNTPAVSLKNNEYIANVTFARIGGTFPVKISATDKEGNTGFYEFFVETRQSQVATQVLASEQKKEMISDIDTLIPQIDTVFEYRYALIVGNEDYKSHQRGLNYEANVEFAKRDAQVFKEYAIKTLGIKEQNILFMVDAKAVEMHRALNQMNSLLKAARGKGEAIVFYAGHGFPDEKSREAHIIPVDISGNDLEFAIKLKDLYSKLSEHPSKGVTVFLDACFSGGGREEGLLAARAVKVRARDEAVKGNMLVLSASAGNESALPYRDKFHGLFTYYLLKALKDSQGTITMGELVDFVTSKVATGSIIHNNKEQNPTLNVSYQISEGWRTWRFDK